MEETTWGPLVGMALFWAIILRAAITRKPCCSRDWIGAAAEEWDDWSPVGRFTVKLLLGFMTIVTVWLIVRTVARLA